MLAQQQERRDCDLDWEGIKKKKVTIESVLEADLDAYCTAARAAVADAPSK